MLAFDTRHGLLALLLSSFAAAGCAGDDPATGAGGGGGGGGDVSPITKAIDAAAGGTISDPDGKVSLIFPAGSLPEDTEVTLTITPKRPETATKVYEFGPAGLALAVPAKLSISVAGVSVPAVQKAVLAVEADGGWGELPGSAEGSGGLEAPIANLASFSVILVDAPAGPCDAGCMSQPGAVCCTTCGCEGAVQCAPLCGGDAPWDCELGCCFDYELLECVP